ncbi:MAG: ABC transporter ATP-binding protein [Pseudomonadota bacterium]
MTLLNVDGLGIAFGGVRAVDNVSFAVPPGVIFSIIGPNGAGKTTLFNLISGLYRPGMGKVWFDGKPATGLPPHQLANLGLSRTFQNLQIFFRMTALENVMVGRHLREHRSFLSNLLHLPATRRQNAETRDAAHALLERVGLSDYADTIAGNMPYGALKRLEIARALATDPKLLLLDEPAAGCNPVETEEIDALILDVKWQGVTVLLVEHDMKLVMKISDRILVLDHGEVLAEGTAEDVRQNPAVIAAYLGEHGQKEIARADG